MSTAGFLLVSYHIVCRLVVHFLHSFHALHLALRPSKLLRGPAWLEAPVACALRATSSHAYSLASSRLACACTR
eukprot:4910870-Amphidinium_carterae.2